MSLSEKRNKRSPVGLLESEQPALVTPPESRGEPAGTDCPHCFGTGMEVVPGEGARRCRCQTPTSGNVCFNRRAFRRVTNIHDSGLRGRRR